MLFDLDQVVCLDGKWGYWQDMPNQGRVFVDERDIPVDKRPWRPFELGTPYNTATGQLGATKPDEQFYVNSHYLVFKRVWARSKRRRGKEEVIWLSLRTVENDARHDWREMQRVKNELAGADWEGAELYPAESRVVDSANQYHLFCFPFQLPFGFTERLVMTPEDGATSHPGAVQRAFAKEGS